MDALLAAATAALAVAVELIEALAIVLAVGVSRRWRDALIGAAAGAVTCVALAGVLGAGVLASIPIGALRLTIGTLLLLFGLEWLRKGTLRLAGRRAPSSAQAEYDETVDDLDEVALPPEGEADWAGRAVAFKGVLIEGVEIVLIVSVIASDHARRVPALIGAAVAMAATIGAGIWARGALMKVPETEVKWGVGVLLSSFGVFFCGEGLSVDWPGGDVALLYIAAILALTSQLQAHALARELRTA
ncbi:MAG: hypothetical protein QOE56_2533 [Solirubrobacterales bacterium]|nr:hypothetical protein [Solirubrobacterales bacterium]